MLSPGTGPVSLQISKESKTLSRRPLPPATPSTDDASGPGNRCSCYLRKAARKNLAKSMVCPGSVIFLKQDKPCVFFLVGSLN